MNHLQHETSPYLLQHVHNPVEWYAWREEAFERARREDKPVLVSIGYSTCHWCHVMERESFEDEATAAYMNQHFINIKVDREERPDLDQIYMDACQIITGAGGWPLNCFLLPDGRPFYANTYFPPQPMHNRPSWMQVLNNIAHMYKNKRRQLEEQAGRLTQRIQQTDDIFLRDDLLELAPQEAFSPENLRAIGEQILKSADKREGGIGNAPKFPSTFSLNYLLEYQHFMDAEAALQHLKLSLDKMIRGGIYDQLGGGFARYATDRAWLVPHFEKMLYDNALLVSLLSSAYQASKKPLYEQTIRETLSFIEREMTHPAGGFYSALDADSEGEEGKFYVWRYSEVQQILGEEAELFCQFYGLEPQGNWEGKNILWRPHDKEAFARERGLAVEELEAQLERHRKQLFEEREKRVRPGLDDKIILAWNALMCSAYARAAAALGEDAYRDSAERNLQFLKKHLRPDDASAAMLHTIREGRAQYPAYLDDYAYLIAALLDVYEVTFQPEHLEEASALMDFVQQHFFDADNGFFYYTAKDQEQVLVRKRELLDSSVPSGNSTMAHNLMRLGVLLDRRDYQEQAYGMLKRVRESVEKYATSFANWGSAMIRSVFGYREIAVVGAQAETLAGQVNRLYIPNKVIMASTTADEAYPLLAGRNADGKTQVYVCHNYTCQMPVTTLEEVKNLVSA